MPGIGPPGDGIGEDGRTLFRREDAVKHAPDALPENVISVIHRALADDPQRLNDFLDGLDKRLHILATQPGISAQRELVAFVGKWSVDVLLQEDDDWLGQVADSEARIESGELGKPIDAAGLRKTLLG